MWSITIIRNSTLFPIVSLPNIKLNLAFGVARLPGVEKPEKNQELSHGGHREKSQIHRPIFGSSLSPDDLGSPGL